MKLLIPKSCGCIRSRVDGRLLALCARCRAHTDPGFAARCVEPDARENRPLRKHLRTKRISTR